MSEFIADARVRVLPDLSQFTTELTKDLNKQITKFNASAAKSLKPIQVPVAAGAISKAQMAGVAASATQANRALSATSVSSAAVTANFARMNAAGRKSTATLLGAGTATARLDAALLGLRTAVGSTAVIGLGAAALAAIALGKAIRSTFAITVAYERELNVFQAVTGASASEMERVAAAAKELGADITLPAVSAADAAVAMSELAKAGLSVQDAIDGARGVLQLATAANISFADAVELAAAAINAFQLSGKDAVAVADTLANAANLAQGSITDIGLSLAQSSAVAEQAGVSYRDTAAFLTLLARAGLKGSDAGTSLRTALIRLINPTKEAQAILDELGVSIRDVSGNIRPDIFIQIANGMRGMEPAARDAKLAILGGQDALRAFAILGRTSTRDFLALRAELRKQGTAADVAAARTKGLGGAMQALQSTLETIGITLGSKVAPGFTDLVNSTTAAANALAQSEGVAAVFSGAMNGVATALGAVGTAVSVAAPLLLGMTDALAGIGALDPAANILALAAAIAALNLVMKSSIALAIQQRAVILGGAFVSGFNAAIRQAQLANLEAPFMALGRMNVASRALTGTMGGLTAAFRVAFAAIGGWTTVVLAAGAAALYLLTRESAAEKATRALKEATSDLATAQTSAKSATEGLASAQRAADTSGLAVAQAKLARETAAAALASSDAAAGSRERRALEIDLAVATQNVTFAMQDATKATKDLTQAQLESEAAALAVKAAIDQEIESMLNLQAASLFGGGLLDNPNAPPLDQLFPGAGKILESLGLKDARTDLERFNDALRENAKTLLASGNAALVFRGKAEQAIAAIQQELGRPLTPIQWRRILAAKDLESITKRIRAILAAAGIEGGDALVIGILQQAGLLPRGIADSISKAGIAADREAQIVGRNIGTTMADATNNAFKGALEIGDILAAAAARGESPAQQLARATTEQAKAQAAFTKIDVATKGGTVGTDAQLAAWQAALERVTTANKEVERIQGEIKSAQQEQISLAEKAQSDADKAAQAIFDAITGSDTARAIQRNIERAALTPGLKDDIRFTKALIAYFKNIQKNLYARLKATGASGAVIKEIMQAISDTLFQLGLDLKRLRKEQQEAIEAVNEAARSELMAKFDAQIRFFEIKENVAGQIKAHKAKLAAITKELVKLKNQGKKNTAAWWDLKAQQAEEQAAIKELQGQTKEKNKALSALMFTFLQTQQGFAANLLGNLIGGGLTGGLVGNVSGPNAEAAVSPVLRPGLMPEDRRTNLSPGADLVAQQQISAGARLGVSRGQGTTQVELLRSILQTLNDIKRGAGFPGAQYQRRQASAAMDTGGGGGGVLAA